MSGQNIMGGINRQNVQQVVRRKAEGSNYIGVGDNLLDFGSAKSFLQEDNAGKIFSINISNTGASELAVALFAGNFAEGSSYLGSAKVVKDGEIVADLNAKGTPEKIEALSAYMKANPSRLRAIKVKADDEAQLDYAITYKSVSPFKSPITEERIPSQYASSKDQNSKVIELTDIDWILGADNILLTTIGAGRSVVISLVFGASLDTEKGLQNKAKEAMQNAAVLGFAQ